MVGRLIVRVFNITGAVVLSLLVWAWFLSMQPQMYSALSHALVWEYNLYSGHNGQDRNSLIETVWEDANYMDEATYHSVVRGSYVEGKARYTWTGYKEGS